MNFYGRVECNRALDGHVRYQRQLLACLQIIAHYRAPATRSG